MRVVKTWIHINSLAQLFDRFVILARPHVNGAEFGVDDQRERIKFLCALHLGDGFINPPRGQEWSVAVPVMGRRIIRIQFDCSLIFSGGFSPFIIRTQTASQGRVSLG